MSNNQVRSITGMVFLLFHFIILIVCVLFKMIDWFDEMTLCISFSILAPLLAPYTPRIIKMFVRNKHEFEKGTPVNKWYTTTVFSIVGLFIALLLTIIIRQAIKPSSIKSFIESMGAVEAIFGLYIELIISDLFHQADAPSTSSTLSTDLD